MGARLLFPAFWLLSLLLPVSRLRAQGRPMGPWRVVHHKTKRTSDDWGVPEKDTTTTWRTELEIVAVTWDSVPDSIRLFLNCENPLIAPSLPRKGQLPIRFTATGATVRLDAKNHRLLIAPSATVVTLWAHRGRTLVFKHQFEAIPPPAPTVTCFYSGTSPTNHKPGEDWPLSVSIKAIPDVNFATLMPDDARYRAALYRVSYLRNNTPLEPARTIHGPQSTIGNPKDFQKGDLLRVEVQLVNRMNFRGEIEDLPLHKEFVFPVFFIEAQR